jgi:hypothetical protein
MTLEMIVGIILIAINVPLGWFGMLWLGYYGKKTGKKIYYILSVTVYVFSWLLLAAGFYLCGKDYASFIIDKYIKTYMYPVVILSLVAFILIFLIKKRRNKK